MPVFEERFEVAAPPEAVWAFLLDPKRLAPCVPGCEHIEVMDETTFQVRLKVRVGFLSTTQDMRVTLAELDPPRHLVSVGRGEDRRLGSHVDVRSTLDLAPEGADRTAVRYRNEVKVRGRLGSIGDAVMKVTAKELGARFAANVRSAIEAAPGAR